MSASADIGTAASTTSLSSSYDYCSDSEFVVMRVRSDWLSDFRFSRFNRIMGRNQTGNMTFGLANIIRRRDPQSSREQFAFYIFILRYYDQRLDGSYFIITCVFWRYDQTYFFVPTLWSNLVTIAISFPTLRSGLVTITTFFPTLRSGCVPTLRSGSAVIAKDLWCQRHGWNSLDILFYFRRYGQTRCWSQLRYCSFAWLLRAELFSCSTTVAVWSWRLVALLDRDFL